MVRTLDPMALLAVIALLVLGGCGMRSEIDLPLDANAGASEREPAAALAQPDNSQPIAVEILRWAEREGWVTKQRSLAPQAFVASWYQGDGLGVNLYLDLAADGNFCCDWEGCLGLYGTMTGTWRLTPNGLDLRCNEATGLFETRPSLMLGRLQLVASGEAIGLVKPSDLELLAGFGSIGGLAPAFRKTEPHRRG